MTEEKLGHVQEWMLEDREKKLGRKLTPAEKDACLDPYELVDFSEEDLKKERKMISNAEEYQTAHPFPHTVLQDYWDADTLRAILAEWPEESNHRWIYKKCANSEKRHIPHTWLMGHETAKFFRMLNSDEFLEELTALTGIEDLHPDYELQGGGLHYIPVNGFLQTHADFNWHPKLGMVRRINLLIYLNDWEEGDGGEIELWDEDLSNCVVKEPPSFNKTVIFNTTSTSWHGHGHPCNVERKSLAVYYYSPGEVSKKHSTLYV
jgi:hypothetical protein